MITIPLQQVEACDIKQMQFPFCMSLNLKVGLGGKQAELNKDRLKRNDDDLPTATSSYD